VLARGTVSEVIEDSGLYTWIVHGEDVRALAAELQNVTGIDQVSVFGVTLHVSGKDKAALERAIAPYLQRPGFTWSEASPSLEDVFIHLMAPFRERLTG
jgi:ABC-2 type transport system ATP-binding protein